MTLKDARSTKPLTSTQLRAVIEAIDDCLLFVLDSSNRVVLHNRNAQTVAGSADEATAWLSGPNFHDPVSRARLNQESTPLAKLRDESSVLPVTIGYLDLQGAERITTFSVRNLDHAGLRMLMGRDVSGAENQGHIAADFEPEALAHDLGNVLGIVQMAVDGFDRMSLPQEADIKRADLAHAVQRGLALMTALMGPDAQPAQDRGPVNVTSALDAAIKIIGRVLPETMDLSLSLAPEVFATGCERSDLDAAMIELLGAAREFLATQPSRDGNITVALATHNGHCEISVTAARVQDAHAKTRARSGSAISRDRLDLTKRLAEKAGGTFRTQKPTSAVRTFILSLPHAPAQGQLVGMDLSKATNSLQGYRICLAETDKSLRRTLADHLKECGGNVVSCRTGPDLEQVLDGPSLFDVVITNPDLGDGTTAERVATQIAQGGSGTRLIVLTGQNRWIWTHREKPLALVLSKPVPVEVLLNAIRLRPPLRDAQIGSVPQ
ncbi:HAMP domain-containing histidine kinase [Thalassococcus sp. S3]|uniref:HAMP domain-containing histidine kinase n=1 Tax=Thalassococcus sp. S3 TaxID=2017482 RepID=UPI00102468BD|nr:HAMP domain-containing histidine kinase [Thalassococcus sp. S3]QBF33038.1 hypothetical protein CFI11_17680 [Thalassococcus sp. S3]